MIISYAGAQEVSFLAVTSKASLDTDEYYKSLDSEFPDKVSKYIDSYGEYFYAVDGVCNCLINVPDK